MGSDSSSEILMARSQRVKKIADELGFMDCGISPATELPEDRKRLASWLNAGYQAKMQWMENHFDKRTDPRELVPGAKSVISVIYNYYQQDGSFSNAPKVARYAQGEDYHFVMKKKLKTFLQRIDEEIHTTEGRVFVDSAPVLDRAWAARSGLGWIGRNSMLIHPKKGSYFFIGELIIDLELVEDGPISDHCGTCTACVDACPTEAIIPGRTVDSNKCISYLTIENRDDVIPEEFAGKMEGWAFGCDICQEVCPWNRFSVADSDLAFQSDPERNLSFQDWEQMDEEQFRNKFRKTPVMRTKWEGMKRNINFLGLDNDGTE